MEAVRGPQGQWSPRIPEDGVGIHLSTVPTIATLGQPYVESLSLGVLLPLQAQTCHLYLLGVC